MLIKDITIDWLREYRDDPDQINWSVVSCHYDFTINQLRQFEDYVDWNAYFIYHYHHSQTIPEAMEFKDKSVDWCWMWRFSKKPLVDREYLKRWLYEIVEYDRTWRYITKAQKLDKEFLFLNSNGSKYFDWDDVIDLIPEWKFELKENK